MIKNQVRTFAAILLMALITSGGAHASGTLQLKTSIEDVNGVRDIEAGKYPAGIRKLQALLNKTSVAGNRRPLLTNLCVAYIATEQLNEAQRICDEAIHKGTSRASIIALNNRAVLHYLRGNVALAMADLQTAREAERFTHLIAQNSNIIAGNTAVAKH